MADNTQEGQKRKYTVGDGVLALWTSDGKWRRGVIGNIQDDEAIVNCSEECLVQPTHVKVTALMPDVASNPTERSCGISRSEVEITGVHGKKGVMEEVFYHKDVEAWMEKIVKQSGNDKITSSILSRVALPGNKSLPMQPSHVKMETSRNSSAGPSGIGGLSQNLMSGIDKSQTNSYVSPDKLPLNSSLPVLKQMSNPSNLAMIPSSLSNLATKPSTNPGNLTTNPSSGPGNLTTNPYLGPGNCATNPSSGPGNLATNPSSGPGNLATNPSSGPGNLATPPSSGPGNCATNPSSGPGNLATNPYSGPGNLATPPSSGPGNLATMARTGRGSRYLQSLLVTTPASITQIHFELMADALSAMTHPKACFVVQKLLDVSDPPSINQIVHVVAQNFSSLSLNQFGCHVVQKALSVAANPVVLVVQLENYGVLMNMLHSPHGTHVAQACLPHLPPRTTSFIVTSVRGQVVSLGRNQHATYFLQKMVTNNFVEGSGVSVIVEEILKHVAELAHDQNGTWLVQAVLKSGDGAVRRLSSWVIANLLTVYKSQPAMFLALAVVEKLREKCKASQSWAVLLAELVVAMADRHVAGKPLLVVAALHQTGHLLAREVARQVTYLGNGRARDRIVEVVTRYAVMLGSDSYGTLVLKGLHEASSCYNLKPLK